MTIKKQIEKHIKDDIAFMSDALQFTANADLNLVQAQAIKELVKAYDLVHRGKKGK